MKKYHAILIIFLTVLAIFGCKKDSSKPTPEKEVPKLEGNWKVSYRVYDNYAGDNFVDSYTLKETANSQTTFNTDGTGSFTADGNEKTNFNYTFAESKLKFTNVQYSGYASNYKWLTLKDFEYTDVKLGVNDLTYTATGSVAQPALYTRYVAKIHLLKQ